MTLFVFCAAVGAAVLVLQLVASLVGFEHGGHDAAHGGHAGDAVGAEGLNLFSVRAVAAGVGAFGLAGLGFLAARLPFWVAAAGACVAAFAAMAGVAALMRTFLRLESDGTVRIADAVGQPAVVYLGVPGAEAGVGKVHITLQNRTVELRAVTKQPVQLSTGAEVIVVDVLGPDTVEIVPFPSLEV